MKECALELSLPFTVLIIQSFREGIFPILFEKAQIKPIHKKNEKIYPEQLSANGPFAYCFKNNRQSHV